MLTVFAFIFVKNGCKGAVDVMVTVEDDRCGAYEVFVKVVTKADLPDALQLPQLSTTTPHFKFASEQKHESGNKFELTGHLNIVEKSDLEEKVDNVDKKRQGNAHIFVYLVCNS